MFFVCLSFCSLAQENLILNPSFEQWGNKLPTNWEVISKSPDFFRAGVCFYPSVQYKNPHDSIYFARGAHGTSYVGLVSSEIIQGRLKEPLIADKNYQLDFYISRHSLPKPQAIYKTLSVKFSKATAPKGLDHKLVSKYTTVPIVDTSFYTTNEWVKVSTEYIAEGGEQYFQLGDFKDLYKDYGLAGLTPRFCYDRFSLYQKNEQVIAFEHDKSDLDKTALRTLDNLLKLNLEEFAILINGYASSVGDAAYNLELSKLRCSAVKDYLLANQNFNSNLIINAYGESSSVLQDSSFQKVTIALRPLMRDSLSYNKQLADRLSLMFEQDQQIRAAHDPCYRQQASKFDCDSLEQQMKIIDSLNQLSLLKILDKKGYPGLSLVGKENQNAAFFMLLHMPFEVRSRYESLVIAAAHNCEFDYNLVPYFIDRQLIDKGEEQLYGTQAYFSEQLQKLVLFDIQNETEVDKRRMQYNLGPLKNYIDSLKN